MRAILFANGDLKSSPQLQDTDLIIAADGGAKHCMAFGVIPAYVVGDMDSLNPGDLETLGERGAQIIRYPRRKDFTDLELALQYLEKLQKDDGLNIDEIVIYGALGSRWDQTIANLLLAGSCTIAPIHLEDEFQEIHFVHSGEDLRILGSPGDTVSLIPLGASVDGIITHCLEYPLTDEHLLFGSTRGISNVLQTEQAEIKIEKGLLAVLVIHLFNPSNSEKNHER